MLPKLVLTDIDGVWTDGGMYYDQQDNEWKKFNTNDSGGVLFLRLLSIPVGIITGETTRIVERRAQKLKIDYLYQGVKNKLLIATQLCEQLNIELKDVAYMGDDINDIQLLKAVGISAAPANALPYVKKEVSFITNKSGGDGAFREFIEHILEQNNKMELVMSMYFEQQQAFNQ
jgi:3-deoxy-D-glycero-D-galacto-nononate 9-phosphatase